MNENKIIERISKIDWLEFLGYSCAKLDGNSDNHDFGNCSDDTPECLEVKKLQVSPVRAESTKLFELQTLTEDGLLVFDFAFREVKPWFLPILYAVKDVEEELHQDYTIRLEFTPTVSPKYRRSKLLSAIGIIKDTHLFRFGGSKLEQRRLLIHQGNYPRDSKGCLLIGNKMEHKDELHSGSQVIVGSSVKMSELWSRVGQDNSVYIYISSHILNSVLESLVKD